MKNVFLFALGTTGVIMVLYGVSPKVKAAIDGLWAEMKLMKQGLPEAHEADGQSDQFADHYEIDRM